MDLEQVLLVGIFIEWVPVAYQASSCHNLVKSLSTVLSGLCNSMLDSHIREFSLVNKKWIFEAVSRDTCLQSCSKVAESSTSTPVVVWSNKLVFSPTPVWKNSWIRISFNSSFILSYSLIVLILHTILFCKRFGLKSSEWARDESAVSQFEWWNAVANESSIRFEKVWNVLLLEKQSIDLY